MAQTGVEIARVDRSARPADVRERDVVVNVASTTEDVARPWAEAGRRSRGYVDACPTDASLEAVGRGTGAPVVAGVGWLATVGEALAQVAAGCLAAPAHVHITGWVPHRRSVLVTATPRERDEWYRAIGRPLRAFEDGAEASERIAHERRLAWFPRPVGPHHAVSVHGIHRYTLPLLVPGLRTARTALAVSSVWAEVLQGAGNIAHLRGQPPRPRRPGRASRGTRQERWAVVAEVANEDGELVRGWAYGHDRHGLTAQLVATVAWAMAEGEHAPGIGAATQLVAPEQLLDGMTADTDLRWSVT